MKKKERKERENYSAKKIMTIIGAVLCFPFSTPITHNRKPLKFLLHQMAHSKKSSHWLV
jgi:hypothetical protein